MERRSPIPPPGQILGEGLMLEWRQNIEQRDKKRRGEALYPPPLVKFYGRVGMETKY